MRTTPVGSTHRAPQALGYGVGRDAAVDRKRDACAWYAQMGERTEPERKRRLHVLLAQDEWEALVSLAKRLRCTVSDAVRRLIMGDKA